MKVEDKEKLVKTSAIYTKAKKFETWVKENLTDEERERYYLENPLMLTLTTTKIDIKSFLFKMWMEVIE